MKNLLVIAFLLFSFIGYNPLFAQEEGETDEEKISDEELMKFAVMEDSVAAFYEQKNEELIDMIRNNETIEGAARYNEIKAAWGDDEKMAEIEVSEEEKEAYEEIMDFMSSLADEVRDLKIDLIKNDEVLGVATYNKVNKAIKENPEIKEKVDNLQAELKEKRSSEDEVDPDEGE